jgi:hypothetical protein
MMGVARPALPQRRVAPEQANASDPLKLGSHVRRVRGRVIGGVIPLRTKRVRMGRASRLLRSRGLDG